MRRLNLEQTDDKALIEQVQQGDHSAFNVLVERWQARIHRFAFRFFADVDDASEITQETFIKVYQKVDTLDDPGKFSSWIYRVANNLCLDELKRAGRRKSSPLEASTMSRLRRAGWVDQMETSQTPAKKLEAKELGEVLQKALLTLPDEQRIVIILKEYEGMKFREIAEILEEPENTIKSRMYYGLKSMRRVLKKWNIQNEYLNHD